MKETSVRQEIFELIQSKFGGLIIWARIESDIALKCTELIEPINDVKTKLFIIHLKSLKEFLSEKAGILESELEFLDEEIERHENTKQISLYVEEEDEMPEAEIRKYASMGKNTEGVVAIHKDYNFIQLGKLTNGVFRITGDIKFYISKERKIYGMIMAELFEHHQEIPVATLVERKAENKETGEKDKRIVLFGQKYDKLRYNKIREIPVKFFVYRFISEDKTDMVLISPTRCEIGDYIVTGVVTQCDDYKLVSETSRLPIKLPFFFAQSVRNRIIRFKTHEEFFSRLNYLKILDPKNEFFEFPFAIREKQKSWKLLHPEWYKWLIWSWITHESKGKFNNYPLHLMILGPKNSGKSLLLNVLHSKSKESRDVFSGSSSTLKSLIPSFKYNPAKLGYLAESNRFSYCDEFLRCLTNTRASPNSMQSREESVALMNDLLEHQKREAGSGVSKVRVNMTSRILATTNPIRGIYNVQDLIGQLDGSFLSRWLIYYQTEDHVQLVRKSNDHTLERYNFYINSNDWVSIIDYLHNFSSEYDMDIVEEIHESVRLILSETLNSHYDARHKHHIECIIDGIIKTRCVIEGDKSFKAKPKDYKILKMVWFSIIRSWIKPDAIRNLPIEKRIFYLPENCQSIYSALQKSGRTEIPFILHELVKEEMGIEEFHESWTVLKEMNLVNEEGGGKFGQAYRPPEIKNVQQERL